MKSSRELSELEQFLHQAGSAGAQVSQGGFSIARDKRLEKLAEFQLPFKAAWAVKVVQSAIHGGEGQPVVICSSRMDARFSFSVTWDLDDLELGFYEPETVTDESLTYMLQALWAVGLAQKRPFLLVLQDTEFALFWDGEKMARKPHTREELSSITVAHRGLGSGIDLLAGSRENAEIVQAICDRCFACPVPLSLDGRRLDSILNCPTAGWSAKGACPLVLEFQDAGVPPLQLPPGTLEAVAAPRPITDVHQRRIADIGSRNLEKKPASTNADFPFLLTYHNEPKHSKVIWIKSGVMVGSDEVAERTSCTFTCYLSANDLKTDLTGLQLEQSVERTERIKAVVKAAHIYLNSNWWRNLPLKDLKHKAQAADSAIGVGTIVSGGIMFAASPVVGALLFVGALGAALRRISSSPSRGHFETLERAIEELLEALRRSRRRELKG